MDELSRAFRKMHLLAVETIEKAYKTLSKEQQNKLEELVGQN